MANCSISANSSISHNRHSKKRQAGAIFYPNHKWSLRIFTAKVFVSYHMSSFKFKTEYRTFPWLFRKKVTDFLISVVFNLVHIKELITEKTMFNLFRCSFNHEGDLVKVDDSDLSFEVQLVISCLCTITTCTLVPVKAHEVCLGETQQVFPAFHSYLSSFLVACAKRNVWQVCCCTSYIFIFLSCKCQQSDTNTRSISDVLMVPDCLVRTLHCL